jgi:hypothetical protein
MSRQNSHTKKWRLKNYIFKKLYGTVQQSLKSDLFHCVIYQVILVEENSSFYIAVIAMSLEGDI